jgi:hypothetical protein
MTIITITGPTCSGKTTLEAELVKMGCGKAVSHTTRSPRPGEIDGQDYHFISEIEYDVLDRLGEFIEKISFGTTRYAVSVKSMQEALKGHEHAVVVAEPIGVEQILNWALLNNLPRYALWLDVNPATRARRFMSRVITELAFSRDLDKTMGTGAVRLTEMLGTEQRWTDNAVRGTIDNYFSYDWKIMSVASVEVIARHVLVGAGNKSR